MTTTKRYESSEPGTRRWLAGLGHEGYSPVFAAKIWQRMEQGSLTVDEAVAAEKAEIVARVLGPDDPFEGL